MKANKCSECGNETFQKDCICVLCRNGITQMYKDLVDSLQDNEKMELLQALKLMEMRLK